MDTFGATSGATTTRIRSAQFTQWSQFFFFQRFYGWSRLTRPGARSFQRGSPPTETRRRFVLRFPRSQDKDFIFRMQRYASLDSCDGLSHRCHPSTRTSQYDGSTPIEDHTMFPLSITPDTASKGLRTLAPWNVSRLEMSPPPCRSVRTFTVKSHKLSIFSPPGPTYRCPFTEPFDGFKSTVESSGFTTDSPAPESTVISQHRPRSPSMDMLPIVTAFRSTSSGHHSPSVELSLGRCSPSLEVSYCGALIGRHSYTPNFWHTEQAGKFTERGNLSHRVQTSVRFVPKDPFVAKHQTVLASHPDNQGMDPLRLGDLHCTVSETYRKTSLSS